MYILLNNIFNCVKTIIYVLRPVSMLLAVLLQTLATMLSSIPLTARGPAQIMVFDIHALQERFYFSETVIPRSEVNHE